MSSSVDSNSQLWRGALRPAMLVSFISMLLNFFISGSAGLLGALLASFTVVIFFSVSPHELVNRESFGVSALAIAAAWLIGEVRAFFKLRLQLPLPASSETRKANPS
jgi:hypothetical protein